MRRRAIFAVTTATLVAGLTVAALAAETADLSTWTSESYPGFATPESQPGNWVVSAGGATVVQTVNGAPTFFVAPSSQDAHRHRITATLTTPDLSDNDAFGFALGFDPGETGDPSADYLLIDWRRELQAITWPDSPLAVGFPGLAVSRVSGLPLWGELWQHTTFSGGGVTELARASTKAVSGWDAHTTYQIVIEYRADRLLLWLDGVLEFDLAGTFPTGGFALYNFSQTGVEIGSVTFERLNEAPAVSSAADDVAVDEGETAASSGAFDDPDGDPLILACEGECAGFADLGGGNWSWQRVEPEGPATHTVTVTAHDGGASASDSFVVTVANLSPVIGSTSGTPSMHPLDQSLVVSATFTDPGVEDTHTAVFDWGDGTSSAGTVDEAAGTGTASGSHEYDGPGEYTVTVTVTDDDGAADTTTIGTVFVFDPDTFVTGGGWIETPPGAVTGDPGWAGRATVGFVARYDRSGDVRGNLEFHAGRGLRLHAESLSDLRILGGVARFNGTGRLNGTSGYWFSVVATDERVAASDSDLFWITITDPGGSVVYDRSLLAPAPLTGKGVQIHKS